MGNFDQSITPEEKLFDAVLYLDPTESVVEMNGRLRSLLGMQDCPAKLSVKEIFDFVLPDDRPAFKTFLQTDSAHDRSDIRFYDKYGKWVWLRLKKIRFEEKWMIAGMDLTEEKERLQILLSSESMQNTGGWLLDLSRDKLHWTPATYTLHDLNPKEDEITLERAISFYKEGKNRERLLNLIDSAISEGKSFEGEFIIITASGEEKWVFAKGHPFGTKNSGRQIHGTIRDITKEKTNELALIRAKERFQSTFDHTGIGMALISPEGNVLNVNRKLSAIFGYSNREIRGKHFTEFAYKEDLNLGKDLKNKLDQGEIDSYTINKRYVHKSGRLVFAKLTTALIRNYEGDPLHYISQVEDLSELELAKSELKESEIRFQEIFNATFQLCAVLDIDGTLIEANQTALDFAGLKQHEVRGKKFWKTGWWKNSSEVEQRLVKSITAAANGKTERYQTSILDYGGAPNLIDFTVKPLSDEHGKVKGIIAEGRVIQDLFEAKQDLEAMIQKLTEQNEKLRNFTQIVSHNLRSHASNIQALSELLREDYGNLELRENIAKASSNLLETIEHLNSIIRIQEKSHEEQKTNIEVRLVVDKTMETLRTLIKQKNALVYNAVPKNLKFKSIPAYIDSILLNLISNALKYSRNEQNPQILISAAKSEHLLRISVTDNGVGMDLKKYGDRLFGMYKTFHGNRDAKGVGLFITKNQVEALGGRIKVESEINVGSKFIIELPDHEREVISCR